METRTPAAWVEYLSQEHAPVTLNEFMAGCLARILGALTESTLAAQHTEGMLGALDQFAAELAARSGIEYAADGVVREALDARRDAQRRLAADERARALEEG